MTTRFGHVLTVIGLILFINQSHGQVRMNEPQRIILAIGAHAGDMEVSCGAVLAKQAKKGDKVVLLHLTLGEGGNPGMSPSAYGEQKKQEAKEVAQAIGAEVIVGPYKDGELMNTQETQRYVAEIIRQVKPSHIITHWKTSIHKDHVNTHAIVIDAVLLASLEGTVTTSPRHRGIRKIYFTENWEDPEGFTPYLFVDVTNEMEQWKEWIVKYQFIKGGISSFAYLEYYMALARVRGAVVGRQYAIAFDIDSFEKKSVVDGLP